MTIWLDYWFNIWPFTAILNTQIAYAKVGSNFCQILNSHSQKCQRLLNFRQTLVTLNWTVTLSFQLKWLKSSAAICMLSGCQRYQDFVIDGMESFFYSYGKLVANYPLAFIVLSLGLTGLCSLGLTCFKQEQNGLKLWVPEHSSQR